MNPTLYTSFIVASTVLVLIPGPNVTLIIANALAHGRAAALATVAGTTLAQALSLALTVAGTATALALMAEWFHVLRWIGVAYLAYLAFRQWRSPTLVLGQVQPASISHRRHFAAGALVAATNPKTLLFYAAFLPQFIDPGRPAFAQMAILGGTYLAIALTLDSGYALAAARLKSLFVSSRAARTRNRIAAGFLGAAALWLALTRRQGA